MPEDIEPELKAKRVVFLRREKIYAALGMADALEVARRALGHRSMTMTGSEEQ